MKWPWRRIVDTGARVALATGPQRLAYAWCDASGRLRGCGVEERGSDPSPEFRRRLQALALPPQGAVVVLPLAASQLLQVPAPPVKPAELKAAARWRVKDLVDGRLDELAIDVMFVGGEAERPQRELFVAAAPATTVQAGVEAARDAGVEVAVVDIAETAQRNLQSALAAAAGLAGRATAALVRHGSQALLTLCADGELYQSRRIDWDTLAVAPAHTQGRALQRSVELAFEDADYVDYGAEPDDAGGAAAGEVPRLVIELQRSFDHWERSWPALPLVALWVDAGADTDALVALLAATLPQRVSALQPELAVPGFDRLAATPALRAAVLPLLGGLLRGDPRQP